jgi:hypothetical protein
MGLWDGSHAGCSLLMTRDGGKALQSQPPLAISQQRVASNEPRLTSNEPRKGGWNGPKPVPCEMDIEGDM